MTASLFLRVNLKTRKMAVWTSVDKPDYAEWPEGVKLPLN